MERGEVEFLDELFRKGSSISFYELEVFFVQKNETCVKMGDFRAIYFQNHVQLSLLSG